MTNKFRQVPVKIRITVVGAKGVGKSACIVNFLQNKFLYDYSSKQDLSYHTQVIIDETTCDLEITDVTKHNIFQGTDSLPMQKCEAVDAFVVVYAIDSRRSFEEALHWHSKLAERHPDTPILLLANKVDVHYERQVDSEEGKDLGKDLFFEVSAYYTVTRSVQQAFITLIRKVMVLRNCQPVKRKLSMTKKIGSIFTRKDSIWRISTSASI